MRSDRRLTCPARSGDLDGAPYGGRWRRILDHHGARPAGVLAALLGLALLAAPGWAIAEQVTLTISNFTDRAIEVRFTGAMCTLRTGTTYRLEDTARTAGLQLDHHVFALPTTTPEQAIFGGSKEAVEAKAAGPALEPDARCAKLDHGCALKTFVDLGASIGGPGQEVLVAYPEAIGMNGGQLTLQDSQVLVRPKDGRRPRVRAACPFVRIDPGVADRVVTVRKGDPAEPEMGPTRVSAAGVAVPEARHVVVTRRGEGRIDVYVHAAAPAAKEVRLMGRRSRECITRSRAAVVTRDCDASPGLTLVPVTVAPDRHMIRDPHGKRCLAVDPRRAGKLKWAACRSKDTAQHWRLLDEVNSADSRISKMYDHVRSEASGKCLFHQRGKPPVTEPCDPGDAHEQWKAVPE